MWQAFKCGCERDGVELSGTHVKSDEQSVADKVGGNHHYPKGYEPKTWCIGHQSTRPCACDVPPKKSFKEVMKKGKKR